MNRLLPRHIFSVHRFPELATHLFFCFAAVSGAAWGRRRSSTDFVESSSPPSSTWTRYRVPRRQLPGRSSALPATDATQVCMALSLVLLPHLSPFTHTMYLFMIAVRGKEGTSLLTGQGRLPEAACSCLNECVSCFPVAPQENVSCPGCELGLNAPDGPAAPGRKGPCLA